MKRWIQLIAALYPRSWREEFGEEFDALLDDVKPSWRVFANVFGGAITMQMTEGTNWQKVVIAMACLGALIGVGASFTVPPNYASSAVMSVTPQPDPAQNTSTEALRQRAAERVTTMEANILSRTSLSLLIQDPRLGLYREELKLTPLDDVIDKMRSNIRIQVRPSTEGGLAPIAFSITFSYPDQTKAQAVVNELTRKFTDENANRNRMTEAAYRGLSHDISAVTNTNLPLAPPAGTARAVLNSATPPTETVGMSPALSVATGLGIGLIVGLLAVLALRWRHAALRLAVFGGAGFALTLALSYLVPVHYTSTAVVALTPLLPELQASLPAPTSATELLRQIEPQLLSFEDLSRLLRDPKLNLYRRELATKSVDEVVQNMRGNFQFAPITTPTSPQSALSISFTYSDRYKAMQTVTFLMARIQDLNQARQENRPGLSEIARRIIQRKAGENLEVLSLPTLPPPAWHKRLAIAAVGLVTGLLFGAFTLRPRPVTTDQRKIQPSSIA